MRTETARRRVGAWECGLLPAAWFYARGGVQNSSRESRSIRPPRGSGTGFFEHAPESFITVPRCFPRLLVVRFDHFENEFRKGVLVMLGQSRGSLKGLS